MISVVQVKLQTSPEQFRALSATLAACNAAANRASQIAFDAGAISGRSKVSAYDLQKLAYCQMKQTLCAQPALLIASIDAPAAALKAGPHLNRKSGWLGVDLGIVNIASTSDGLRYAGGKLTGIRKRHARLRKRLQAKGTKSALRLLKARSRREARFATDLNHQVSKSIVTEAERTGRGIAVEELTGIRERVRLRKPQRVALHSWSFHQLGSFLEYKAERAGIPFIQVDPTYTSQTCHDCGNKDKASRVNQATYICRACGVVAHADVNAAFNIAVRGADCWAAVDRPYAA